MNFSSLRNKSAKNQTVAATEEQHVPLIRDIIENYNPIYLVGGCIYNALNAMQWIIKKPKVATFVGCVGDDKYANLLIEKVSKEQIDVRFEKLQSKSTSFCLVLLTGDYRTLVTSIGSSNLFSEGHVENIWPCVEGAQYFYIMGFSLVKDFDFCMKVAKHSHENDKNLIMNLSAGYICKNYKNEFLEIFPYIDVIIGNELEALAFATALNLKSSHFIELCSEISNLPKKNGKKKRICIVTRTEKPVICVSGDVIKEFPVISVPQEDIVDTNGAGDAFVGGFLAQLIAGQDVDDCVKCGLYTASVCLQHIGCNFDTRV